jgi:hypothetical protein
MGDILFKLRVLYMMLYHGIEGAITEWKSDVWRKDLDSSYCCSGHECGCMATTVRELYSWHLGEDTRHD